MDVLLIKKPYEVSFTGNPMPFIFTLTPYGPLQRKQNYKLQVNVLVEDYPDSGLFITSFSQIFFPSDTGVIQMDVNTIIDAYLNFYTPKFTLEKPVECIEQRKRYKLSYQLQLDDDLVSAVVSTSVFYALKGGIAYEEWSPVKFFEQNVISDKQPLQYPPDGEKVALSQKLFLAWLYPLSDLKLQTVKFTFYWDDESNTNYTLPATLKTGKWGVCIAPVGVSQIAYTFPTGKTLVYYEIEVYNADDVTIAQFAYYIDYRAFYNTYTIMYRNSLGGLSSIRLRGQVDIEADYEYQQSQRITPASYFANQILLPQLVQEPNSEPEKFTGDTGFISKEAINNLRDLFLSRQRYEVNENARLIPIVLNGNNVKLFSNKNSLFSLQVQWQRAFINEYYTPEGTISQLAASCPAVENFQVVQVNKDTLQIIWSLVTPYDQIKVEIDNGDTVKTIYYTGNSGSVLENFENPAEETPVDITVTGQTICDGDADPVVAGPVTTVTVSVKSNSKPVAVNDTYSINGGFTAPVLLPGNVLANDYDPDGDDIEATAASGATNAGGSYTLNTDGTVSYEPPSSGYSGQDWFNYKVHEVLDPTSESLNAKVYINVGGSTFVKVYVRLVTQNVKFYSSQLGDWWHTAERYLKFFSDVAGTVPINTTGLGIVVNVQKTVDWSDDREDPIITNLTFNASGTSLLFYQGEIDHLFHSIGSIRYIKHAIQPGDGYTPIP